ASAMLCSSCIILCQSRSPTQHTISLSSLFFFNDTVTTEIYTLSLHDALPISSARASSAIASPIIRLRRRCSAANPASSFSRRSRSEEHTSELQSLTNIVCRLLLEKKKTILSDQTRHTTSLHDTVPRPSSRRST